MTGRQHVGTLLVIHLLLGAGLAPASTQARELYLSEPLAQPTQDPYCLLTPNKPSASRGPASATEKKEHVYDEQGIKTTRSRLESKGLEIFRNPAGTYTFNVGVHSMYIYSITQCLPLQKDLELRFNLKQVMPQYQSDGSNVELPTGGASTKATLSVFFAF